MSTNLFAFELQKQNLAKNGDVIIAEYQMQGKGQGGKEWKSAAFKNLMFSVIYMPVTSSALYPFSMNKAVTLSVKKTLENYIRPEILSIKWPNDIYTDSAKISGVLIENNYSGQTLNFSVIGIGLNVNQNFSPQDRLNASSMSEYLGKDLDRTEVFQKLLETLEEQLLLCETVGGIEQIETEFDRALLGYRQVCTFLTESGSFEARIMGCDNNGQLLLEKDREVQAYLHGSIQQKII